MKEVPSIISEPRKWFQVVDMNKDHRLSMLEVLHVRRPFSRPWLRLARGHVFEDELSTSRQTLIVRSLLRAGLARAAAN